MLRRKIAMFNERESYGDGSKWFRGPIIGKGSSCSVFMSNLKPDVDDKTHHKLRQTMAVKSSKDPNSLSSLQHEENILETINKGNNGCPYIVQCFGFEVTIGKTGETAYNLLLEYGDGGTLRAKIRGISGKGLPEEEVKIFAKCIAKGLHHIHARGYMHRDLTPDNIILVATSKPFDEPEKVCTNNNAGEGSSTLQEKKANTTKKTNYTAKICDFGCAKDFMKVIKMKEPYLKGNIRYLSPEAAVTNEQGPEGDVWALGCIVFEMLTGESVWRMSSDLEIGKVLVDMGNGIKHYGKMPGRLSDNSISFMEACFTIDTRHRWSAKMLLDHPFIKGV